MCRFDQERTFTQRGQAWFYPLTAVVFAPAAPVALLPRCPPGNYCPISCRSNSPSLNGVLRMSPRDAHGKHVRTNPKILTRTNRFLTTEERSLAVLVNTPERSFTNVFERYDIFIAFNRLFCHHRAYLQIRC